MLKRNEDGTLSFSTRFWVYTIMATAIICWIGVRTQLTANRVEREAAETSQFANETQDCFNQLIVTLKARADLSNQRDDLSEHQRFLIFEMFRDLLSPPDNIKVLPANDPVRQKWGEDLAQGYVNQLAVDQAKVDQLTDDRNAHSIPDPTCGVKPLR